jgi:hypothetical protein
MDPARDTPIIRSTIYLRGIGIFLMFALLLAVIWLFTHKAPESLEDVVARTRYATKAQLEETQAASLSQQAIDAAIPAVAEQLAAAKPAAVEKPEQVIPGSPTAAKLAPKLVSTPAPIDSKVKDADKPPVPAPNPPQP